MGVSKGLGPLGVHVNTEEGVSFQTDNEMYWSSYCNGNSNRLQAREEKDVTSKFRVSSLQNGKVVFQDFRDMYMSLAVYNGITYLEMEKSIPDELCEFEVFHDEEKVMLKASSGKFICRTFHNHGQTVLEVSRSKAEDCCRFRTGMGDMYKPCFDICSMEWDDVSNLTCRPCVIKADKYINRTDEVQEHEFKMTWDSQTTETTQWTRPWGLNSRLSNKCPLLASEATITYNGSFQNSATTYRVFSVKREKKVLVQPQSEAHAQLIVSKITNVSLPFKVYIRKTKVDGDYLDLVEAGVWKGLVYDSVNLEVEHHPIGTFSDCSCM